MSFILYGNESWTSPYVLSVFVALRAKGVEFRVETLAMGKGQHREATYADLSLTSRVPTLIDGDFALSESSAIVEYLEDRFPAPGHARLLPEDLRARARARQVMAWVRSDVGALRDERSAEYVFYPTASLPELAPLSRSGQRAANKVVHLATSLVPEDGGPLFGAWCIADTDLAMMLWRLTRNGHALPRKLHVFADAQWERPAVREFVEKPRPAKFATPT